ncbi:hypothetical protein RI367_002263 [Sorochytrium milnesiophthora]
MQPSQKSPRNSSSPSREMHGQVRAALPFLPGYTFNFDQRPNFRKSHAFDQSNQVSVFREEAPGIGGLPLPGQENKQAGTSASLYPTNQDATEAVPAWIAFDRKVLRFFGYFQESVQEMRDEQYRIRKVHILFYLEDDTVHVIEPRSENSGIPQGTLIRRHRMPLPGAKPHDRQFYIVSDLNVGKEVTFYSRMCKIVGCDAFTRDFLAKMGVEVPPNTDYPSDPYDCHRKELLSRMRPTRPVPPKTSLKKFLENDRKVLRFFCVWDDSTEAFGDARKMVLHYFLADDTIEIHERIDPNSGRDAATGFLRRGKIPKKLKLVGTSQAPAHAADSFYTDRDLMIGAVLNVYGRPFLLCDCDEFTKDYYRERYGLADFSPIAYDAIYLEDSVLPPTPITSTVPPYNGWGSEEDSLGSYVALVPKPPKKDFKRIQQLDNVVLRYAAVMNTNKQVDRERRFVVSYFIADDTFSIFEPYQRNSGIVGGKFLERTKVPLGHGLRDNQGHTRHLESRDLYIGAELTFCSFPFVLIGADEYALQYMDEHPEQFPHHKPRKNPLPAGANIVLTDEEKGTGDKRATTMRSSMSQGPGGDQTLAKSAEDAKGVRFMDAQGPGGAASKPNLSIDPTLRTRPSGGAM